MGVGDFYAADSHAAGSFTSTNCGEGRAVSEEEGQEQKQREGAERGMTEKERKKKSAHNRERKLGPKASKVAKGEK